MGLRKSLVEGRREVPEQVRLLGWLSFFNDAASELLYPIIPLFITGTLGAPVAVVGLIEGVSNAAATVMRLPAGALSDRIGRRRLIRLGYGVSAVAKPLLAIAPVWPVALFLRSADRIGKGIRSAPRDALITDLTTPENRATAFGYHRSMDSLGAVVGPLAGAALLATGLPLRWVMATVAVPSLAAILVSVRVEDRLSPTRESNSPMRSRERFRTRLKSALRAMLALPERLRWMLVAFVVFSLGNSADVFILLRGFDLGMSAAIGTIAYVFYNLVYSGLAFPVGKLTNRIGAIRILMVSLLTFAVVYAGLAAAGAAWQMWPLFALYGLHMAMLEGTLRVAIAAEAEQDRLGATIGLFTAAAGVAALLASVGAGLAWDVVGPEPVFLVGAILALAAMTILVLTRPGSVAA